MFNNLFQSTTTTITPAINADAVSWIIYISELGTIPKEPNKTIVLCGIAIDSKTNRATAKKSQPIINNPSDSFLLSIPDKATRKENIKLAITIAIRIKK